MIEEYYDILDESGNKTGKAKPASEVHEKELWHGGVHIWIVNDNNEVLMQKRADNVEINPGILDISCAGHIIAGESPLEGAIRELREELGIEVNIEDLEYIKMIKNWHQIRDKYMHNTIDYMFIIKKDIPIYNIKIQKEEVESVKYISIKELHNMFNRKETVNNELEYEILFERFDR